MSRVIPFSPVASTGDYVIPSIVQTFRPPALAVSAAAMIIFRPPREFGFFEPVFRGRELLITVEREEVGFIPRKRESF